MVAWTDRSASTGGTVTVTASLTNNSFVTGSAYDNTTNLDTYGSIDCTFASFTPGTNGYLQFFLQQALDGTNFDDAPSSTNNGTHMLVGEVTANAAATAKHIIVPMFPIPPGQFKITMRNVSGATMSATPGTLKLYTTNLQNV
jgi:hypothetical protein